MDLFYRRRTQRFFLNFRVSHRMQSNSPHTNPTPHTKPLYKQEHHENKPIHLITTFTVMSASASLYDSLPQRSGTLRRKKTEEEKQVSTILKALGLSPTKMGRDHALDLVAQFRNVAVQSKENVAKSNGEELPSGSWEQAKQNWFEGRKEPTLSKYKHVISLFEESLREDRRNLLQSEDRVRFNQADIERFKNWMITKFGRQSNTPHHYLRCFHSFCSSMVGSFTTKNIFEAYLI